MEIKAQPPHQAANVAFFKPSPRHVLSTAHTVQSQVHAGQTLFACQFEPPSEGRMQFVDRLMLEGVCSPKAAIFEVRNVMRKPPSAYVYSFNWADIEQAQQQCKEVLSQSAMLPRRTTKHLVTQDLSRLCPGDNEHSITRLPIRPEMAKGYAPVPFDLPPIRETVARVQAASTDGQIDFKPGQQFIKEPKPEAPLWDGTYSS